MGSVDPSNSAAKVCVISRNAKNIVDKIIYKNRSESGKTSLYISSGNRCSRHLPLVVCFLRPVCRATNEILH